MKPYKRTRVLFTIPNFKTAGSQYVVLSFFKRINKKVFEPFVCVENHSDLIPEEVPIENRLIFQWTGKKRRDVNDFKNLLKNHKIDLLHSWDYKSNYFEALATRMAGVKYLYTKKNNSWSKRWQLKSFLSNHIAYDNPEMKNRFFNSWLVKNKISFIPHGVDTEIFKPLHSNPRNSYNLVCIANINANKNQLFLLRTLNQLSGNVVLHLYGKEDEEYRTELEDFISENRLKSRVHFHGFVTNRNIPEVLKNMDIFVLPSINEGLPVSILEAMACGVSILCSDSGGGARYLLDSEFIFSLNAPKELSKKINRFQKMKDWERQEIIKKGLQKILEQHTIEREIMTYENLYKEIFRKK